MRESTVEDYLIKRVKEAGGIIRKVKWLGYNGAPDRLVGFKADGCGPFVTQFPAHPLVELKRPGKAAEAHQKREHKKLKAIGFDVWVINTKPKVDKFIKYYTGK